MKGGFVWGGVCVWGGGGRGGWVLSREGLYKSGE